MLQSITRQRSGLVRNLTGGPVFLKNLNCFCWITPSFEACERVSCWNAKWIISSSTRASLLLLRSTIPSFSIPYMQARYSLMDGLCKERALCLGDKSSVFGRVEWVRYTCLGRWDRVLRDIDGFEGDLKLLMSLNRLHLHWNRWWFPCRVHNDIVYIIIQIDNCYHMLAVRDLCVF